jgi:hypothetical protein
VNLFKAQFDKLLLTGLLLILVGVFLHALHHAADVGTINWFTNTIGQVLAALLTLMVGRSMNTRNGDHPSDPPKP